MLTQHIVNGLTNMPQSWTHLIRFVALEDNQIHLGQLVHPGRDIGLDSISGRKIEAYLVLGRLFDGTVTKTKMTVKQVSNVHVPYMVMMLANSLQASLTCVTRGVQHHQMCWTQLQGPRRGRCRYYHTSGYLPY